MSAATLNVSGKSAVVFRGTCRAQPLQLQQRLEYLWDLNPADVSTLAGMLPGGEVQVMVVGPSGPEFLRRVQHAWVEHRRPSQREDGRALAYQRLMLLAGGEAVVFLGDPDDHWIDRTEAECLEDQVRERIVGRPITGQSFRTTLAFFLRADCRETECRPIRGEKLELTP
jgi:hypothetical protein